MTRHLFPECTPRPVLALCNVGWAAAASREKNCGAFWLRALMANISCYRSQLSILRASAVAEVKENQEDFDTAEKKREWLCKRPDMSKSWTGFSASGKKRVSREARSLKIHVFAWCCFNSWLFAAVFMLFQPSAVCCWSKCLMVE